MIICSYRSIPPLSLPPPLASLPPLCHFLPSRRQKLIIENVTFHSRRHRFCCSFSAVLFVCIFSASQVCWGAGKSIAQVKEGRIDWERDLAVYQLWKWERAAEKRQLGRPHGASRWWQMILIGRQWPRKWGEVKGLAAEAVYASRPRSISL